MRKKVSLPAAVCLVVLGIAEDGLRAVVFFRTPRGLTFDREPVFELSPDTTVYGVELNASGFIGDDLRPRTSRHGPL